MIMAITNSVRGSTWLAILRCLVQCTRIAELRCPAAAALCVAIMLWGRGCYCSYPGRCPYSAYSDFRCWHWVSADSWLYSKHNVATVIIQSYCAKIAYYYDHSPIQKSLGPLRSREALAPPSHDTSRHKLQSSVTSHYILKTQCHQYFKRNVQRSFIGFRERCKRETFEETIDCH